MRNLTLMTDLYQLTMMNGYYYADKTNEQAVFDLFFRQRHQINYAVAAGLEQAIDYIENLHFDKDDIEYLKSLRLFGAEFLEYLKSFKFTGDIYAVREGEIVFPQEPLLIVKAPLIQAQLIETALLNIINHQTLIATKASRIVTAAGDNAVIEFGLRRAQGPDAGIYGARAAIIGGCNGTSNVMAGKLFNSDIKGTHSHSWIMSFNSELEAFRAYASSYPDACLLLVDTYNTINGIKNAIIVFDELKAAGHKPLGIRLDSGDLAYLSKKARKMLDDAGHGDAIIFACGDIDEHLIISLTAQNAKIDVYGVGTKLITCDDMPSLGGVYKLSQINGKPVMKISDSAVKITNPGEKTLYRVYNKNDKKAEADLIALKGEGLDKPLTLTHEYERWKTITFSDYEYEELLIPVFKNGVKVYECPTLENIARYARQQKNRFWEEYLRILNPHIFKVDISDSLYALKQGFLKGHDRHGN